jgi:quercetin dioxygenase-like cupin family protein
MVRSPFQSWRSLVESRVARFDTDQVYLRLACRKQSAYLRRILVAQRRAEPSRIAQHIWIMPFGRTAMTHYAAFDMASALATLPVIANSDCAPLEGGTDPAFGTVQWRTLFCADKTATSGMVMGIAEFGAFGTLLPHRHGPAEIYFGLSGSGHVTIDGAEHSITPGTAIFIPQEAEHGTVAGPEGLRFLYVFPKDRFAEVDYRFTP